MIMIILQQIFTIKSDSFVSDNKWMKILSDLRSIDGKRGQIELSNCQIKDD